MKMFRFTHERLDVYRVSGELVRYVDGLPKAWFHMRADRRDQLQRAADSVLLNIAEGMVQPSRAMRDKYLKIALGSAAECHAILDLLRVKGFDTGPGLEFLARIGAMITRLLSAPPR